MKFGAGILMLWALFGSAVLASPNLDDVVHIQGEKLSASDVLQQLQEQTEFQIEYKVPDESRYRKDYDCTVSAWSIFDALVEYNRVINNIEVEIVDRGHGRMLVQPRKSPVGQGVAKKAVGQNGTSEAAPPAVSPARFFMDTDDEGSAPSGSPARPRKGSVPKNISRYANVQSAQPAPAGVPAGVISMVPKLKPLDLDGVETGPEVQPAPADKGNLEVKVLGTTGDSMRVTAPPELDGAKVETGAGLHTLQDRSKELEGTGRIDEVNASDWMHPGFGGGLSGFMAPQVLPSHLLHGGYSLQVTLAGQFEKENNNPASSESIDDTFNSISGRAKWHFHKDIEGVLELRAGRHNGDFNLRGKNHAPTDASFGDVVVGLNTMILRNLAGNDRLVGGVRLKLPTGNEGDMLGSGSPDGGAFLAYHVQWDESTLSHIQVGYSGYGKMRNMSRTTSMDNGWSASAGLERHIINEYWAFGRLNFSQSPFDKAGTPSFYNRDISDLQLGLMKKVDADTWSLGLDLGLSESAADMGVHLGWLRLVQ